MDVFVLVSCLGNREKLMKTIQEKVKPVEVIPVIGIYDIIVKLEDDSKEMLKYKRDLIKNQSGAGTVMALWNDKEEG